MAHNVEKEIDGVIRTVTEMDHTAQEIDDAVAGYFPLDGSKAMTGALRILADVYASGRYISPSEVRMYAAASDGTTGGEKVRQLSLYSGDSVRPDIRNALQLQTGAGAEYNVLHTGNKPSGSYTGNGDATARTIETGGIGNAALVWSSEGMGFLTRMGIVYCPLNSSAVTQNNSITFADGIINIAANSAAGCNTAGITYYYQVL